MSRVRLPYHTARGESPYAERRRRENSDRISRPVRFVTAVRGTMTDEPCSPRMLVAAPVHVVSSRAHRRRREPAPELGGLKRTPLARTGSATVRPPRRVFAITCFA